MVGIWQGRFQYIHKGHYYIFRNELPKFDGKIVAIVNPNPYYPACSNFARFNENRNPLTYFQRMLLWKEIADEAELQILIVPCWHARYTIALENDFLPKRNSRYWIIPVMQDDAEEDKANDLRRQGEQIHCANFESENDEFARINATMVRNSINGNNKNYKSYIPEVIWELSKKAFLGMDQNEYFVVPFIDNKIDFFSIQKAIELCKQSKSNSYVLITILVHVSEGEKMWRGEERLPWWFKEAKHPKGTNSYYKRSTIIEQVMNKNEFIKYLITPIFVYNSDVDILNEYNSAFLPHSDNIKVVINEALLEADYYKYNFSAWLNNIDESHIVYTFCQEMCETEKSIRDQYQKWFVELSCSDSHDNNCEDMLDIAQAEIGRRINRNIEECERNLDCGGLRDYEKKGIGIMRNTIYHNIHYEFRQRLGILYQKYRNCELDKGKDELVREIEKLYDELDEKLANIRR